MEPVEDGPVPVRVATVELLQSRTCGNTHGSARGGKPRRERGVPSLAARLPSAGRLDLGHVATSGSCTCAAVCQRSGAGLGE